MGLGCYSISFYLLLCLEIVNFRVIVVLKGGGSCCRGVVGGIFIEKSHIQGVGGCQNYQTIIMSLSWDWLGFCGVQLA